MNVADSESRPVLGLARNKSGSFSPHISASKPLRKLDKSVSGVTRSKEKKSQQASSAIASSPEKHSLTMPSVLRRHEQLLHSNLSLNASCSSDASTDSFHSRASTGRLIRSYSVGSRSKSFSTKPRSVVSDGALDSPHSDSPNKKRCAWVTSNTDPSYVAFHDDEWGVPVHDDKRLFELLVLSGALAELTWPTILSKRQTFREAFADFDPIAVANFNEKKLIASGSIASCLLSELKLRAVVENARQILKVIDEFGSFDKYVWSFVNHKPIANKFRYPRQVPVKTPKADAISKDLVRRGFRSVGPTVVYSFMQAAGLTIDHLTGCFRFHECLLAAAATAEDKEKKAIRDNKDEDHKTEIMIKPELSISMDELSFSSE